MSEYKNFTVEMPERLANLDRYFSPIAQKEDLEITYLLMKLSAAFLLPYERVDGTSGARANDLSDPQAIRRYLELDKLFHRSTYCVAPEQWVRIDVDNFSHGPRSWESQGTRVNETVAKVLERIRHATAHSNLYFGGESKVIQHIYFGNRHERDRETDKYIVIRCDVAGLIALVNAWIENVATLRISPSLIWAQLETAA
ncbi:MAG: hypothetical protein U5R46_15320 [Gammaproteobacteria bacterium]|nr:hypothetical protein [Gammaproteobacteria bacterium]